MSRAVLLVLFVTAGFAGVSHAQMGRAVAMLKGDVTATDGTKLQNIQIVIYKGTERVNSTKSNIDGKFTAVLPPDATYRISFSSPDYTFHEETLQVPALEKYQEFTLHPTLSPLRDGADFTPHSMVFMPKASLITPEAQAEMENLVSVLKHNPKLTIAINVYPDAALEAPKKGKKAAPKTGPNQQELVDSRASAIRSFFVGRSIPATRVAINVSMNVPKGRFPNPTPAATTALVDAKKKKKPSAAATSDLIPQYVEITAHLAS